MISYCSGAISQPQALHLRTSSTFSFEVSKRSSCQTAEVQVLSEERSTHTIWDEEDEEDESAKFGEEKEADEAEGTGAETEGLDRGAKKAETEEAEEADQAAENEKGGEAAVSSSTSIIASWLLLSSVTAVRPFCFSAVYRLPRYKFFSNRYGTISLRGKIRGASTAKTSSKEL